jgi:phosphoglycolate phosphatase-like HAD superfamily hydrolase
MSATRTRLVLFDIDGTLLWSDGAGRRAMEAALLAVFGTIGPSSYRYDGKTDRQIVRELMREAGFDDSAIDARMPDVLDLYLERLERELPRSRVRTMVGVTALLGAIGRRPHHVPGLLTGNLEHGAARKLEAAGLDFGFFAVGAFGSDHERRDELPGIARRRARERLGHELAGDAMVIIGDTPSDIACGRSLGARAIAVATGGYGVDELTACEPAAVFADLGDTDAVLRAIDGA